MDHAHRPACPSLKDHVRASFAEEPYPMRDRVVDEVMAGWEDERRLEGVSFRDWTEPELREAYGK